MSSILIAAGCTPEEARAFKAIYEPEPGCECRQTDVDLFDAAHCELHNPSSARNVAAREITDIQRFTNEDCPF